MIRLDADREAIDRHPAANLDGGATPEDAAYVIYTSGSTGEPAGRGRHARRTGQPQPRGGRRCSTSRPADRVLQFSSLSFDIAIEELFPAWSRGAPSCFRDEREPARPRREFSRWVGAKRITVLDLPTAYWHAWVEGLAGLGERLPESLRLVVVGGEKASARRFARPGRAIGGDRIRWINTYGPTEATVDRHGLRAAARGRRPPSCRSAGRSPTRGSTCSTRSMEPVPLGLPGELYIGGEGVARGYLGRPGLTAERFVPDPFGDRPGARLFRTGDRARWRPDGQLEFLGRVDHQVKVRGFRVEPGEVEAVLRRHPGVGEAVVVAREGAAGLRRLVAYVVPRASAGPDVAELRPLAPAALPEYMVPSAFVTLDALPLSPNGKIDRKALPEPAPGLLDPAAEYVAPRDPLEETLARVWADVLELERVGIHDNFFDLGGHSLQSVQLVSATRPGPGPPGLGQDRLRGPDDRRDGGRSSSGRPPSGVGRRGMPRTSRRWPAGYSRRRPPALPEHVSIEGRPFYPLFAKGELAPVDAVALSYFPASLLHSLGLERETVIHDWCGDRPVIADIRQTPHGRIGTVLIPRFEDQLYLDRGDLVAVLADAVRMAHAIGARRCRSRGCSPRPATTAGTWRGPWPARTSADLHRPRDDDRGRRAGRPPGARGGGTRPRRASTSASSAWARSASRRSGSCSRACRIPLA